MLAKVIIGVIFLSALVLSVREVSLTNREEIEVEIDRWWIIKHCTAPGFMGILAVAWGLYRAFALRTATAEVGAFIFLGFAWTLFFMFFFPTRKLKFMKKQEN